MGNEDQTQPGLVQRIGLAFKVLFDAEAAAKLVRALMPPAPAKPVTPAAPKAPPQEKLHASGLFVLATLQEDGRLIDFLQQDVAGFSDEEVGSAARVVHGGCRKALERLVSVESVLKDAEGATVSIQPGFDANRIRLTGNVTGQPPFRGSLKHHGWVAQTLKFPSLSDSVDYRVIAPAEVEI